MKHSLKRRSRGAMAAAFLLATFGLSACSSLTRPPKAYTIHDLGLAEPVRRSDHVPLVGIEVLAPSWLASAAMQYRLNYEAASERRVYSESRWAAMPAEMLRARLARALEAGVSGVASDCSLRVDLDEFQQVFSAADRSQALIEARVGIVLRGTEDLIAQRRIGIAVESKSADASGGVAAMRAASARLAEETAAWLASLDRPGGEGLNIGGRCRR